MLFLHDSLRGYAMWKCRTTGKTSENFEVFTYIMLNVRTHQREDTRESVHERFSMEVQRRRRRQKMRRHEEFLIVNGILGIGAVNARARPRRSNSGWNSSCCSSSAPPAARSHRVLLVKWRMCVCEICLRSVCDYACRRKTGAQAHIQ